MGHLEQQRADLRLVKEGGELLGAVLGRAEMDRELVRERAALKLLSSAGEDEDGQRRDEEISKSERDILVGRC